MRGTGLVLELFGIGSEAGIVSGTGIKSTVGSVSGFHQVALWLGLNGLWLQGLKEYFDSYLAMDYLGPVLGSKCLVMRTTGNYLRLGPLEETSEEMF
jgi:hypothetical protein